MTDASRSPTPLNVPGKTPVRAVLDTNVVIAAHLSRNPHSPTVELLERWLAGEFVQLYSDDTLIELQEKFLERQIDPASADQYTANLLRFGEYVEVAPDQIQTVLVADPDDDLILTCALVSAATHIVTYDPHFDVLGGAYHSIPILDGLHFLYVVRGDTPPGR
ncbi:MAG: putative toxin-antitoxin system toxin component, PIN family [Caldilineaceae bacterium]|nr:putative toxin-antitoxin system toxin component, PIN family [Caldilineaceae bacterium]MBP8107054.1 putative toxin-antitoxin system toxin component, PIN family [Caldilineaceae bacterium]MBP8121092.1 putative toxin-antitoxin system toxin component, PIN family [Caldilineaceae bacterium]MBP9070791.1 putative toxin-antitoxin system toxin component, PIN family [Caldilineaceae bacterium]